MRTVRRVLRVGVVPLREVNRACTVLVRAVERAGVGRCVCLVAVCVLLLALPALIVRWVRLAELDRELLLAVLLLLRV